MAGSPAGWSGCRVLVLVVYGGLIGLAGLPVPAHAHRLHPRAGPGLPDHRDPAAARRLARADRQGRARGRPSWRSRSRARPTPRASPASTAPPSPTRPMPAPSSSPLHAVRGAGRRRASRPRTSWPTCARKLGQMQEALRPGHQPAARARHRHRRRLQDAMSRTAAAAGPQALEAATNELVARANQEPGLTSVFTLFNTRTPKVYADIDRVKAEMLGVPVEQRVRDAQRLSGLVLRQRLQLSRPHLPGAGPGRRRVPPRGARHRQPEDPQRRAATWCRSARSPPSGT